MAQEDRTEIIMIRVTPTDKKTFEAAGKNLDMNVSEFVRAATLLYLAVTMNPHGVKTLVKGAANSIREAMIRLREPGLRRVLSESKEALELGSKNR